MPERPPSPQAAPRPSPRIGAVRITVVYAAVAALWIAFSDRFVAQLDAKPATFELLSTLKGWLFVAVTSVLLWSLLRASQRRVNQQLAARAVAESCLRESEAMLRSYFEDAPMAVFVVDADSRIVDCNPAASALTGFAPSELRGLPVAALHPESERPFAAAALAKLTADLRVQQEFHLRRKDGTTVLVLLRAARVAGGRSIAFCQDITDRRRVELAQQESEARLRLVTDNARVGLVMLDRERRYVFANATYAEILDLPTPDIAGQRVADVLPTLYEDQIRPRLDEAFAGARVVYELARRSGSATHHYMVRYEPTGDSGNVTGVVVVITDITDAKMSEAAFRESETRLRLIGDNLPDSYVYQYQHDPGGRPRFLYVSAGVEKLHQLKAPEVLAHPELLNRQTDIVHLLAMEQKEKQSLRTMSDFDQELRITRPDGEKLWLHVRSRPRLRPDGQVVWDGVATNVTERVQFQETLRQQKAELDAALASMRDAVYVTDANGRPVETNEAFATFHRFPNKAACERAFAERPDLMEVYRPDGSILGFTDWPVTRALRGESSSNQEFVVRRKDSGETWVGSYTFAPIRNRDGVIVGSVITARDVTDITRARQELQASEDRLRALVTLLPDALFINAGDRIVFVNQRAIQLWRATGEHDLLNRSPYDLFHPDEHFAIAKRIARLRKQGGIAPLWETRLLALDGTVIPVETVGTQVPYGSEKGIQVVVRDISERLQTQSSLLASRTLLEDMGRTAHVGGWTLDVVSGNVAWTDELARIHDLDPSEAINLQRGLDFYTEESRPIIEAAVQRAMTEGTPYDLELEILSAKGVRKSVRTIGHPTTEKGLIVRLHGSLQDITDRKKLEAQFLRAQRLEAVGTLAGGVAHDLNNILAPVLMTTGLIRRKLDDPHDQHLLTLVEASAKRGAAIIRQLLTFSRGVEGARVCVQLRHLIKDMEQIMQETFPKNIEISQLAPSDLWTVTADPTQMHQVLMNLCVNARDAMPTGGKISIEAMNKEITDGAGRLDRVAAPGRYVVIAVADTGTGIAPDILSKIFDPFFTTKGLDKGTGLGLSTVMGIVKNHGGYVTVTSELGQGTTFLVHLPVTEASTEHGTVTPFETPSAGRGELVLVVDDERPVLDASSQILASQGYPVLRASDGRAAVELFLQHQDNIRLVITDLMMPIMGGAALIRALRTIKPELRIVTATGQDQEERLAELGELGVQAVLSKPYTSDHLLRVVRQVLDH